MYFDILTISCICILCLWIFTYLCTYIPIPVSLITISSTLVYLGARYSPYTSKDDVMEKKDAAQFPLIASGTLFGLYFLAKKIHFVDLSTLTYIYLTGASAISLFIFLSELIGKIYNKSLFSKTFTLPYFGEVSIDLHVEHIISFILTSITVWYYILTQHWMLVNFFAIVLCITTISSVSIGSLTNGLILLAGLFLYDIFWVFGTEVMVTVATSIQGPIKFLFPKYIPIALDAPIKDYSCLGLGDVAIPGFFISFLYRYDIHKSGKNIEEFSQKDAHYFNTAMIFYILSIAATNVALYFTKHAQPALLYIVPALFIATLSVCIYHHDYENIMKFNEEKPEEVKPKSE